MHSIIYQISNRPIAKEDAVCMDNIMPGDFVSLDYYYDLSEEECKDEIRRLAEHILPKGMFTVNADGKTLTYHGGFSAWSKSYIDNIRAKAEDVDESNVMQWIGPAYQLQKAVVNPLGTDRLFITDFYRRSGTAEHSRELMSLVKELQAGEQLYVGAVIGFHF